MDHLQHLNLLEVKPPTVPLLLDLYQLKNRRRVIGTALTTLDQTSVVTLISEAHHYLVSEFLDFKVTLVDFSIHYQSWHILAFFHGAHGQKPDGRHRQHLWIDSMPTRGRKLQL